MNKSIRGHHGEINFIDQIPSGQCSRITREFLCKIILEMCSNSYKFWKEIKDYYPLTYPERHMYSSFASAIGSITPVHLSEHSIRRKGRGEDPNAGRVDMWARYRNVDHLIEIKRTSFGFSNKAKGSGRVWSSTDAAISQVSKLRSEAKVGWGDKLSLIGMSVALPYSRNSTTRENDLEMSDDRNIKLANDFLREARSQINRSKKINFSATWVPPKNATLFEFEHGVEHIPFIGFSAGVQCFLTR